MKVSRSALVLHPADRMYRLVHDVPSYPRFLSWCADAEVLEQTEELQVATLRVAMGGIRQAFTTRNQLVAGERLVMSLVEGPFRSLNGEWRFTPLGEAGSRVSLDLRFEFSSSLVSVPFQRSFARITERMVRDFCTRADSVYGD